MKINELVEIHTGTNSVNRLNHLLQSQTWRLDVTRSSEQVLVPAVPLADEHVKADRVTVLLRNTFGMRAVGFCQLLSLCSGTKSDVELMMKLGGFCREFDPLC